MSKPNSVCSKCGRILVLYKGLKYCTNEIEWISKADKKLIDEAYLAINDRIVILPKKIDDIEARLGL
jgi:hypothetical protein